jgi:lauroyl/myristoyl acyltransferase
VVPVGGALLKLQDAVQRGRFVGILADRDTRGVGPRLPFFGEVAHMPDGHARIALKTGAPIIPGRIYRRHNWQLVIELLPPVPYDPNVDSVEDITRRCISLLECFIRDHPEQWFSFYDLWSDKELPVA